MVWGGISLGARTDLHIVEGGVLTADRYATEILEEYVVPYAPYIGDRLQLMQDNARPHTANCVRDYLELVAITVMDWPARSPDLNPIEHVWDKLGQLIKKRNPAPTTFQELRSALTEEWDNIPQEYIDSLIKSMPRRMEAVVKARGGNTKY